MRLHFIADRPWYLPVLLADLDRIHVDAVLEPALLVGDLDVVPAHLPLPHQAVVGKRPVLEPVGPPPLARLVVPLVPELDGDLESHECKRTPSSQSLGVHHPVPGKLRTTPPPRGTCGGNKGQKKKKKNKRKTDLVVGKCKQLLAQAVALFLGPLGAQELDDLVAALQEDVTVAPDGVGRVGELDGLGVPGFGGYCARAWMMRRPA